MVGPLQLPTGALPRSDELQFPRSLTPLIKAREAPPFLRICKLPPEMAHWMQVGVLSTWIKR